MWSRCGGCPTTTGWRCLPPTATRPRRACSTWPISSRASIAEPPRDPRSMRARPGRGRGALGAQSRRALAARGIAARPSAARGGRGDRASLPRGRERALRRRASPPVGPATGTATCSPTTSSACPTVRACSTASSSTTTSATATCWPTSRSSRWTSSASVAPDLARCFLDRYADRAGDVWPPSLEHLYVAYRALVRAKVACLRADDGDAAALDVARRAARPLGPSPRCGPRAGSCWWADRRARARPPSPGPSPRGSGSRCCTATRSARSSRASPPRRHERVAIDAGIYTAEWDARTYDALCARAREQLEAGSSVVLDASWSDPVRRAEIGRVAAAASCDVVALQCRVDPGIAAARAAATRVVGPRRVGRDQGDRARARRAVRRLVRCDGRRHRAGPGGRCRSGARAAGGAFEPVISRARRGSRRLRP